MMLGGSNPVGVSRTSLHYIGKHISATSGVVEVGQTPVTVLDFTTAADSYILGHIQICCDNQVSDNYEYIIKLDGQAVWKQRLTETVQDPFGTNYPIEIVIPGQTRVEISLANVSQDVSHGWSTILRGRVYA